MNDLECLVCFMYDWECWVFSLFVNRYWCGGELNVFEIFWCWYPWLGYWLCLVWLWVLALEDFEDVQFVVVLVVIGG